MILRDYKIYLSLFCIIIPMPVFATIYKEEPQPSNNQRLFRVVLGVGGGRAFTSDAGNHTIFPIVNPDMDEQYEYIPNNNNQILGLFNAFLGAEWPLTDSLNLQTGLSYYSIGNFWVKGSLNQGADLPSTDTYTYQYKIQSQQYLIESKFLFTHKRFHPYISFGFGAAYNNASDYAVFFPPFSTFSRQYANNKTTAFAYNVGLGVDYDVNSFIRLGVGYRFMDLGKVSLGSAVIDTTPVSGKLSQSDLTVNEILAQLTFLL